MMKVVVLGGVSYDYKISIDNLDNLTGDNMKYAKDIYEGVGSTGAGKSLALANLGFDVTLFALIGNDIHGKKITEYLKNSNIKFIPIYTDKPTMLHTNIMYEADKRLSIFHEIELGNYNFPIDEIRKECEDADLLIVNIMGYIKDNLDEISKININKFVDIHDYDGDNEYHKSFINIANYIQYSKINIKDNDTFIKEVKMNGCNYIVGTNSCDVMTLHYNDEKYEALTLACDVVDSNGAGDSFSSGIIYAILNNIDPKLHLVYGRTMGYSACLTKEIYNKEFDIKTLLSKI